MKKLWIKKENIYHKPFYKHKFKMTLIGVFLMGIIFFGYQLFYMSQLQISTSPIIIHNNVIKLVLQGTA